MPERQKIDRYSSILRTIKLKRAAQTPSYRQIALQKLNRYQPTYPFFFTGIQKLWAVKKLVTQLKALPSMVDENNFKTARTLVLNTLSRLCTVEIRQRKWNREHRVEPSGRTRLTSIFAALEPEHVRQIEADVKSAYTAQLHRRTR
tara:strand:+ start:363 stop:800 length:438 start_codon:yes stop_codon:yes gene_type:complete